MPRELPQYISQLSMGSVPKVEYSMAPAQATQQISKDAGAIAASMEEKAKKIHELESTATIHENLNRMSLEAGADPGLLKNKIDGFEKEFFKTDDNPELRAKYRILSLPYVDRATEKYNRNLSTELETKSLRAFQTSLNGLRDIIPGLSSQVPEQRKAAEDALNSIFNDTASIATATGADGQFLFTPQQQMAMAGEAQKEFLLSLSPEQRLAALDGKGEMGKHLDLLPADVRERVKLQTIKMINEENNLKQYDPAQWGLNRGMNIQQVVESQDDSELARVIPNEVAKKQVQEIKTFTSQEQLMQFSQQLAAEYQGYAPNALRDLRRQNLPDEYEAAISLAIQNPVGNHERIGLLFNSAKVPTEEFNALYKSSTGGDNPTDIDEKIFTGDFDDQNSLFSDRGYGMNEVMQSMAYEGYSIDERSRLQKVTSNIAKAYRIQNPSVSEDDAISYAAKTITDNYNFAEVNGTKYRIPVFDKDGLIYDRDQVQERVEEHFDGLEFATDAKDAKTAKRISDNAKKTAIPYLNRTQDGLNFLDPINVRPFLDKSGKIAEIKFKDAIAKPTARDIELEEIKTKPLPKTLR